MNDESLELVMFIEGIVPLIALFVVLRMADHTDHLSKHLRIPRLL